MGPVPQSELDCPMSTLKYGSYIHLSDKIALWNGAWELVGMAWKVVGVVWAGVSMAWRIVAWPGE